MQPDYNAMSETELLAMAIRYKKFLEDEPPETTVAEIFQQRLARIRLALKRKEKAAQGGK